MASPSSVRLKCPVVLHRTGKKCTKNHNARAQPLFCSFILLFSDVAAVVSLTPYGSPDNAEFGHFRLLSCTRTATKCTKNHNARAQQLYRSLIRLLGDVPVTVAVIVSLLNSLISGSCFHTILCSFGKKFSFYP